MSSFSLQARWVLPIEGPPIAGGVVTIAEGRIVAVGKRDPDGGPVLDLGDVALLPGLVNVHTHLEFSQLEKPLGKPGMALPDWIRLVIAGRQHANRNPSAAVEAGLQQSSRHGVTTIGEIATGEFYGSSSAEFPQQILFQEVIGFSAARSESVLAEVQQRLQNNRASTSWQSTCITALGLSPHAPYTVHPQLLERLVDLACQQHLPIAMHLAESPEELEFLASASGPFRDILVERSMWDDKAIPQGTKPLDYLKMLARAPRSLAVHGNYFSNEEIQFLSEQRDRMSVAYCPRTHYYFDHSEYPLEKMLSAGVQVALGTDSRASNPDLSLLEEMRFVARRYPKISPSQILELGTLSGAQALGMADEVGSLAPGKWANLIAVPCDAGEMKPEAAILHNSRAATQTWLRGKSVALLS